MKTKILIVLVLFFLMSCAVSVKDIKVNSVKNEEINLKDYKTYTWHSSAQLVWDSEGRWEAPDLDIDHELRSLINRELQAKGLMLVTEKPDVVIRAAIGADLDAMQIKQDENTKMASLQNVPQSALVVILFDADAGYPVWLGYASAEAQKEPDSHKVKKRLDYAVTEIFKQF